MAPTTKKAPKPADEATAAPAGSAFPSIAIIERRIAAGGRNIIRPREVALINQPEPMTTRMVNTAIESRWWQITEELGWVPVRPEEVAGGLPQGDLRAVDGRVVAGEKGGEVLVKMPRAAYRKVQQARAQREHKAMMSKTQFRQRAMAAMERDAKVTDRAGAEQLERASDRMASVEVEQFEVSKELVSLEPTT